MPAASISAYWLLSSSRSSARSRRRLPKNRHAHAALDLVVGVLLVQVDLERAVRHEDDVLLDQVFLDLRVEQIAEMVEDDRRVDAAALAGSSAAR